MLHISLLLFARFSLHLFIYIRLKKLSNNGNVINTAPDHSTGKLIEGDDTVKCQFDVALSFATENQPLVENVYHYLKAKGLRVFFAASPEGQVFISGKTSARCFT